MECKQAISLMHQYFDGDLESERQRKLQTHLHACPACHKRFYQLEKTEALIRSLPPTPSPEELDHRIMAAVPAPRRSLIWLTWARKHPALSAALVFLLIVIGSLFTLSDRNDGQLIVRGTDIDQVIIQGNKVIVPETEVLRGHLVVENGEIQVDGEIQGSLVMIDSTMYMASTAKISGEVTYIDQILDRIWFMAGEWFTSVATP